MARCCGTIVDTVGKTFMFCVPDWTQGADSSKRRMIPSDHIYADKQGGFKSLENDDLSLVQAWIFTVMNDSTSHRARSGATCSRTCVKDM